MIIPKVLVLLLWYVMHKMGGQLSGEEGSGQETPNCPAIGSVLHVEVGWTLAVDWQSL